MPIWPKSFYTFGLSLKTAGTEWNLRRKRAAAGQQERTLPALTARLAKADYWRAAGIERAMPYATFQARVPLQTYDQLAPEIGRMVRGETNVLSPGRCALFTLSSGATTGQAKYLPMPEPMLAHFQRATRDALLYYTVRARNAGVFRGRHLMVGGSTTMMPIAEAAPRKAFVTELSGIVAAGLPPWAEKYIYEPGAAAAELADWPAKLDAIVARTCQRDITLVAGVPQWVAQLATALRERCGASGQPLADLQAIWPNLECFVHTGTPVATYADELRAAFGKSVKFHEVYAAAEGVIATQDTDSSLTGLRLMADLGVFFEFLPLADFDETRLAQLGGKTVPLAGVKAGVDYVLVLTTPAGLARYVLGDVVRFVSTEPPRLTYVGRTALQLNAFGEQVMEKAVTDALVSVCSRHHWVITNFHVAPLFAPNVTGQIRGRHEWWLELRPGTVATPTGPQIATAIEAELQRTQPDYAARRRSGVLDAPVGRLVMPGVFEHWLRYQGRWGGQHRIARCRSDRKIADELAQITNFARD